MKTFAHVLNILCKQLFNIKSKVNREQLIVKQACCTKAQMDFIPPSLWPPNSPDLNPVDCAVWGILQNRVYRNQIKDVEELCQRVKEEWTVLINE